MSLSNLSVNANIVINWLAERLNAQGQVFSPSKYSDLFSLIESLSFGAGTASSQANQIYVNRRTLAPATLTDDLDLSGTLLNPWNETINFTKIKYAIIYNECEAAGENLYVGAGGSNSWVAPFGASSTFKDTIYPNGLWLRTAPLDGFPVTAGSADNLRVRHAGTTRNITYVIVLIGIG